MSVINQHRHELGFNKGLSIIMEMPKVIVVPPEEDQARPWCFFDAKNPALSQVAERPETPEIAVVPYGSSIDAIVMGKRQSSATSVIEALAETDQVDTESEYDDEDEPEQLGRGLPGRPGRDAANDPDVVEVVKVRRRDTVSQVADAHRHQASNVIRPTTLKSRASRAFKSFKGTIKSKQHSQEVASASSSMSSAQDEAGVIGQSVPRSTVTRTNSRVFSGLFKQGSLERRPSVPIFEGPAPPLPTRSATMQTVESSTSHQSLQDDVRFRATSPTPTTVSSKSFRRNLQKLFTFSGNTTSSIPEPPATPIEDSEAEVETEPTTPTLRSVASTPALSSDSSNSGPETPTSTKYQVPPRISSQSDKEERSSTSSFPTSSADPPVLDTLDILFEENGALNLGLGLGINLDSTAPSRQAPHALPRRSSSSSMWDAITPKRLSRSGARQPSPIEDDEDEQDTSLDIHLDSLHFDDLSFDVTRFTFE